MAFVNCVMAGSKSPAHRCSSPSISWRKATPGESVIARSSRDRASGAPARPSAAWCHHGSTARSGAARAARCRNSSAELRHPRESGAAPASFRSSADRPSAASAGWQAFRSEETCSSGAGLASAMPSAGSRAHGVPSASSRSSTKSGLAPERSPVIESQRVTACLRGLSGEKAPGSEPRWRSIDASSAPCLACRTAPWSRRAIAGRCSSGSASCPFRSSARTALASPHRATISAASRSNPGFDFSSPSSTSRLNVGGIVVPASSRPRATSLDRLRTSRVPVSAASCSLKYLTRGCSFLPVWPCAAMSSG